MLEHAKSAIYIYNKKQLHIYIKYNSTNRKLVLERKHIMKIMKPDSASIRDKDRILRVVDRISKQRKEIAEQSENIRDRIRVLAEGSKSILSFSTKELLSESDSVANLSRQYHNLERAKKLPNYADKEFRELSLPYVFAIAEQITEESSQCSERIKQAQDEIKLLNAQIDSDRDLMRSISGKWSKALMEIGINEKSLFNPRIHNYTLLAGIYSELCKKYE